jgi:lipopolysaccharide export LptBFGC system permease protein LptF
MTLPELNAHIRDAPSSRQEELARAHRRNDSGSSQPFVLGLGFALAGRWRSAMATFCVATVVLLLYGVCFGFGAGLDKFGYPPAYGTWTANGAFLIIGLRLLRSREHGTVSL